MPAKGLVHLLTGDTWAIQQLTSVGVVQSRSYRSQGTFSGAVNRVSSCLIRRQARGRKMGSRFYCISKRMRLLVFKGRWKSLVAWSMQNRSIFITIFLILQKTGKLRFICSQRSTGTRKANQRVRFNNLYMVGRHIQPHHESWPLDNLIHYCTFS